MLVERGAVGTYPNNRSTATALLYDPSTGAWPPGGMNTGLADHTATLLLNGQVLVAGGVRFFRRFSTVLTSAEVYTPYLQKVIEESE